MRLNNTGCYPLPFFYLRLLHIVVLAFRFPCLTHLASTSLQELTLGTNHADQEVVVQMYTNSASAGQSPEETERFRKGLQQVVAGLRAQNIQDVESVAGHIAQYRREFLEDPSKILGL